MSPALLVATIMRALWTLKGLVKHKDAVTHLVCCCEDNNPCTQNLCNPVKGCDYSKPTYCYNKDPCTTDSCNPQIRCVRVTVIDNGNEDREGNTTKDNIND